MLTADALIREADRRLMERKRFPEWDGARQGTQVIVSGDDWTGQMVVKASDVAHLLAWVIGQLEGRPRHPARRGVH